VVNETVHNTQIGSKILQELKVSRLTATVKRELYQILGLLIKRNPQKSETISDTVQELLFSELFNEIKNKKKPQIPVVIGSLKGLRHLMYVMEPEAELRKNYFLHS
jgi:hypothetical protein